MAVVPVRLRLLGEFDLRCGEARIGPLPRKAQGLIAYLALHRRPDRDGAVPRESVANLLWGHSGSEQARRSLRECLRAIRAVLGDAAGAITGGGPRLGLSPDIGLDIAEFELLARSPRLGDLETANELYRDEFLAGLHIASEPFVEWLAVERRRLASTRSNLLFRLATLREEAGDAAGAAAVAQQLANFDPLREDAHRLLMRLSAAGGRRSEALKQYARCVDTLRRELGVAPEAATTELADRIRRGAQPAQRAGPEVPAAMPAAAPSGGRVSERPREAASLCVLAFTTLGADPDQNELAHGLAEDIANALSRLRRLSVIADGRSASRRNANADARRIGRKLGVDYLLRGSVRRLGAKVRIVVQLLETTYGGQIWSDRFDYDLADEFAIQDQVAARTAALIEPALHSAELGRARRSPDDVSAYRLFLRAVPIFRRSPRENEEALALLRRAIALDPSYAAAFALAGRCFHFQKVMGWVHPDDARLQEGVRLAGTAGELGRDDCEVLWMAGLALVFLAGDLDHGGALIEKSLLLNPNAANAWIASCFLHAFLGDSRAAIAHFTRAQQLNPLDTVHHVRWNAVGNAHFVAGRFERAAQAADMTLREIPSYPPGLRMKIATCGLLGRIAEGRDYVQRLHAVNPGASVSSLRAFWKPLLRRVPDALESYLEGLRRAGLAEAQVATNA